MHQILNQICPSYPFHYLKLNTYSQKLLDEIYWAFSLMSTRFSTYQVVLIASAQKYFGNPISFNIVLASSFRERFFLSTTPFCCGVLGDEKLCLILDLLQNLSNLSF